MSPVAFKYRNHQELIVTSPGFSHLYSLTDGSGPVNEDLFGMSGEYAWVFDGMTGHRDEPISSYETDGKWYVDNMNEILLDLVDSSSCLPNIAKEAIAQIRKRYLEIAPNNIDRGLDVPGATGVIVRRIKTSDGPDSIEYFLLGDCTLLVEKEHTTAPISDQRGALKEQEQMEAIQRELDAGVSDPWEARNNVEDIFLENKSQINSSGGYWVFGIEPSAVDEALTGRFMTSENLRLHLMTDGFSSLIDTYNIYKNWGEALDAIDNDGPKALMLKIRESESSDPSLRKHPRTKQSDDATLLSIIPTDV